MSKSNNLGRGQPKSNECDVDESNGVHSVARQKGKERRRGHESTKEETKKAVPFVEQYERTLLSATRSMRKGGSVMRARGGEGRECNEVD